MTDSPDVRAESTGRTGFIAEHQLYDSAQAAAAAELLERVQRDGFETVRVAFADIHGIPRGKTLTPQAFASTLRNGLDCSSGPYFFDTGHDIVGDLFSAGGGLGVGELTGASDFVVVPDPSTFRDLPWTDSKTGWILADEYLPSGKPVPFSARQLLRAQLATLAERGLEMVIGVEIEWYLTRMVDPRLTPSSIGGFGAPGAPPEVAPVNIGYQFNSELYADELDPIVSTLRRALIALELPLRTTEHESGPGQMEFTFAPQPALAAADTVIILRNAIKQICAREGYHASFMCRPQLQGFDASGWHLHQSLVEQSGRNVFTSDDPDKLVSALAQSYAGGLVAHGPAACVFTTPTINGYARADDSYSLAPSHVGWSADNRGAFVRVLGGPGDESTHLENRVGEPAANPYLYVASQLVSGLDGIDRTLDPGPLSIDPHARDLPPLPTSLDQAIAALKADQLFKDRFGEAFVEYLVRLKENELRRFHTACDPDGELAFNRPGRVSDWEQREYFRVF